MKQRMSRRNGSVVRGINPPRSRKINVSKPKPKRKPPIKSPTQPIGIRPPLTGRMTLGSKSQRMY